MAGSMQGLIDMAMEAAEEKYREAFETTSGQEGDCSICLQNINSTEVAQVIKACDHFFHPDCLNEWLKKKSSCPLCRVQIYDGYVPLGIQRAAYDAIANAGEAVEQAEAAHAVANLVISSARAGQASRAEVRAAIEDATAALEAAAIAEGRANLVALNDGESEPIESRATSIEEFEAEMSAYTYPELIRGMTRRRMFQNQLRSFAYVALSLRRARLWVRNDQNEVD